MPSKNTKALGFWSLIALVMGNMIGSGIYLLPTSLAGFGKIGIYAWFVTAAGAMLLALLFSALSYHMPAFGGPYYYCKEALGQRMGFFVAYNYWLAMWVGNAAIVIAMVGYLAVLFPILQDNHMAVFMTALVVIWSLTFINAQGVRHAGVLQMGLTALKLLPLVVVLLWGWQSISVERLANLTQPEQPFSLSLSQAAALTLWSFIGLESASVPADNVEHPRRTIPLATLLGTLGTALVYITSTIVIMGVVPQTVLITSTAPYAEVSRLIVGDWGLVLVATGAILACLGTLNGWVLLQGQMPCALAEDGLFPKIFAKRSVNGTPYFSLYVSAFLITVLLSFNLEKSVSHLFTFAISLAVLATLVPYLFTSLSAMLIFWRKRQSYSKRLLVSYLILSVLSLMYSFWMITSVDAITMLYGLILAVTGIPIYLFRKR